MDKAILILVFVSGGELELFTSVSWQIGMK